MSNNPHPDHPASGWCGPAHLAPPDAAGSPRPDPAAQHPDASVQQPGPREHFPDAPGQHRGLPAQHWDPSTQDRDPSAGYPDRFTQEPDAAASPPSDSAAQHPDSSAQHPDPSEYPDSSVQQPGPRDQPPHTSTPQPDPSVQYPGPSTHQNQPPQPHPTNHTRQFPAPGARTHPPYQPQPQSTGALAWGLGLLVLAFFPFVSSLIASGAMMIAGHLQRTRGELAATNGRNAFNWGLTYLLATVLLVGAHFGMLVAIPDGDPIKQGFFPMGIAITVWALVTVLHLVLSVIGLIQSASRKVFRAPAIPFLRR